MPSQTPIPGEPVEWSDGGGRFRAHQTSLGSGSSTGGRVNRSRHYCPGFNRLLNFFRPGSAAIRAGAVVVGSHRSPTGIALRCWIGAHFRSSPLVPLSWSHPGLSLPHHATRSETRRVSRRIASSRRTGPRHPCRNGRSSDRGAGRTETCQSPFRTSFLSPRAQQ